MQAIKQMNALPQDQRGATLIVALILLVLISLIGVSTLRSASVVEKMSSNEYQKNITFQASESAVDLTLQDQSFIAQTIQSSAPIEFNDVAINVPNAKADVVYTYVGFGAVDGASLGENGVSGQRVMITSTGYLDGDENTTTRTVHGIVQLAPGVGGG